MNIGKIDALPGAFRANKLRFAKTYSHSNVLAEIQGLSLAALEAIPQKPILSVLGNRRVGGRHAWVFFMRWRLDSFGTNLILFSVVKNKLR